MLADHLIHFKYRQKNGKNNSPDNPSHTYYHDRLYQ